MSYCRVFGCFNLIVGTFQMNILAQIIFWNFAFNFATLKMSSLKEFYGSPSKKEFGIGFTMIKCKVTYS